jgi:hypothetical protein
VGCLFEFLMYGIEKGWAVSELEQRSRSHDQLVDLIWSDWCHTDPKQKMPMVGILFLITVQIMFTVFGYERKILKM